MEDQRPRRAATRRDSGISAAEFVVTPKRVYAPPSVTNRAVSLAVFGGMGSKAENQNPGVGSRKKRA